MLFLRFCEFFAYFVNFFKEAGKFTLLYFKNVSFLLKPLKNYRNNINFCFLFEKFREFFLNFFVKCYEKL